jgi:hypothetical protein
MTLFSFQVKDRQGLILLIKALKLGLHTQGFQASSPLLNLALSSGSLLSVESSFVDPPLVRGKDLRIRIRTS